MSSLRAEDSAPLPPRIPEVWRKAGLALATLIVCELGARIVTPGLNGQVLKDFLQAGSGTWLQHVYDWAVGGASSRGAVLALGIMPYVSARIYVRLARLARPALERMWHTRVGREKLTKATRWITGGLALVQSFGFATFVQGVPGAVAHPGFGFLARTMAVLTAGALGVMLLSERLSDRRDDDDVPMSDDATTRVAVPRPLEQPSVDDHLLGPGQFSDADFSRPRRDRAGIRREPGDAERD